MAFPLRVWRRRTCRPNRHQCT